MILSLIAWLAMQGQVQFCPDLGPRPPLAAGAIEIYRDYCTGKLRCVDSDGHPKAVEECADAMLPTKPVEDKPKPAEHVIEIKTLRKVQSGPKEIGCYWWSSSKANDPLAEGMLNNSECDNWREIRKGNPLWQDNGEAQMWVADKKRKVKVTRELWIDGVRWGVVKGLE